MKISVSKLNSIAMDFLILFLLFSGIIEYRAIWHIIILMLFVIIFVTNKFFNKIDFKDFAILSTVGFLFIMSALFGAGNEYLGNNLRSSLYALCSLGI